MATQIRFFGVAAYEIITSRGQHILIDPFLDENPGSPVKSEQLEQARSNGERMPGAVILWPGEVWTVERNDERPTTIDDGR